MTLWFYIDGLSERRTRCNLCELQALRNITSMLAEIYNWFIKDSILWALKRGQDAPGRTGHLHQGEEYTLFEVRRGQKKL